MSRTLALRPPSPLPGWGLATGITVTLLSLVVLLPIGALLLRAAQVGPFPIVVRLEKFDHDGLVAMAILASSFALPINPIQVGLRRMTDGI